MSAATSLPAVAALPARRAQVALAVAAGGSVTEAAQKAGVHRSTVYDWIRSDPAFSAALDQARRDYIGLLRDQLRSLSVKALNRIESLLDDPATPAAVALRAALAVLNRPRFPDPGWTLPESVGEGDWLVCPAAHSAKWTDRPVPLRRQQDIPIENDALAEADYKALGQRERLKRASAESRSPDTIRHNPTEFSISGVDSGGETPEPPGAPGPETDNHPLFPLETGAAALGHFEQAAEVSADENRQNPTQIAALSPPPADVPPAASLSASAPLRAPNFAPSAPPREPIPRGTLPPATSHQQPATSKKCCGASHRP